MEPGINWLPFEPYKLRECKCGPKQIIFFSDHRIVPAHLIKAYMGLER